MTVSAGSYTGYLWLSIALRYPLSARTAKMPDDALFPDLFVPWDEITPDEMAAFESALDGARDEHDMQRFLEDHRRMLIQHLVGGRGAWVIPKKRLGSEHETDFVIAQKASDGFVWYAVELERPQAKTFNKNGDPSAALTHALRQISDWRIWLSRNLDYAARSRERSGLGLIDIYPDLEGLIIMGRDAEVDQRTTALRREWVRAHRVKIETYDSLLYDARERLAARQEQTPEIVGATLDSLGAYVRRREEPARKAVREVFGGIFSTTTSTSAVRKIDWQGVYLDPDHPDVEVPLQIVYAQGKLADHFLQVHDWIDWIEHVQRDLVAGPSLLVTEDAPAVDLQEMLTLEQDGIWYALERLQWRPDEKPYISRLNILVHLPPALSYEAKRSRIAIAREVFLRYTALERERKLERERAAELKIVSLSLAPGDSVSHDKFGLGTVVSTSGSGADGEAMIDFGTEFGVKHLVLRYAPLKKLG